MREYGKTAGFAAAGAFLLSLVVGLVSRNPFGAALARALLLAVVFACLAAAARYILAKYLPELVTTTPSPGTSAVGQNVDITLPEEGPPAAARAGVYERTPRAPVTAEGDVEEPEELAADLTREDTEPQGDAAGKHAALGPEESGQAEQGDILADELDDVLPPLADMGAETEGFSAGEAEAGGDSVEEAESVPEDGTGRSAAEGEVTPDADSELGRLPEISSFGNPSSARGAAPPLRSRRGGESSRPEDEMKGALGSQDPATLARAIRTVLKRDEKG
ncbi:MAG: hypothetical protein ABSG38_17725 [Spirochaetia bacterium]